MSCILTNPRASDKVLQCFDLQRLLLGFGKNVGNKLDDIIFKHLRNKHGFLRNVPYSLQKLGTLIEVRHFCQTFCSLVIVQ